MRLSTRIRRSSRIAWTGLRLWLLYKAPALLRRWLGRPPLEDHDLDPTHERAAKRLFQTALEGGDLTALERGLLVYANTEAAGAATLELARRHLDSSDPTAAARVLQRFLSERPGSPGPLSGRSP